MTPQLWSRMKEIFGAALEKPESERSAFLDSACDGDAELRAEVERLLAKIDSTLHGPIGALQELAPGAMVAHYRIETILGEGGMGVVYKADDTHLKRFVAIKLLHAGDLRDEERVRRFTHEARTASSLNHPNIVTIYEIATHYGAPVIVMEYVPGKSLDRLIPRNGVHLDELLRLGGQIAGALAAAAAAGIIHRDVKPANIIVTDAGNVKVLDFGLAKLHERAPSAEQETATIVPHTLEGAILGTASYMSPEQAEGKPVDLRSDIFSFGAVLYEMVTGQRAFRGDTTLSTLSAILRDEPKPVSQIAADTPRDLEKIITRCLRKDPERRFQSMADVRVALLELEQESQAPVRKRRWLWVSLAAATLVMLNAVLWFAKLRTSPLPPQRLVPVTTYPGSEMYPSFSPDGKQIAFYWDGEKGVNPGIYVKLLGETNALRLTSGPDAYPAWSPDGARIAFVRGEPGHGVHLVSALGGEERKILDIDASRQISWSPDGKWLALSRGGPYGSAIFLLPLDGGPARRFSSPKAPAFDTAPAFAPDGHRLAWAGCAGRYSCDVYVQELGRDASPVGTPRQVTRQAVEIYGLTWGRDGRSLVYSAAHMIAAPYLWRTGSDGGQEPQRLDIAGLMAYAPSASLTANRLAFHRSIKDLDIWRYRVNGGMEPLIVSSLLDFAPDYSPDGIRIAFCSNRSGEATEIWVAQADGTRAIRITNGPGRSQGTPRWSPDGRWIAFDSEGRDGRWDIYAIEAGGSSPRRITSESSDAHMPFWSHDCKWIYFYSNRTGSHQIWRTPFGGGRAEQVTTRGGLMGYVSTDGTMLFYTKDYVGPAFARLLSGGEEHQVLPYISYREFLPVADGIYYIGRKSDEGYYPLEFFEFSTKTSRLLEKIEGQIAQGLSVSPDRKSILVTRSVGGADLMMIENFQ